MDSKQHSILMLPWLAHGHVSLFLELAKKLSQRNFNIYFCSTPINLKPLRETLPLNLSSSIQLIDIYLPSQNLPPHYHTTKDLSPHLVATLKTSFDDTKPAFFTILKTLKPKLIIYDFLQPWVPIAARKENIEVMFSDMQRSVVLFQLTAPMIQIRITLFRNLISQQFNARKLFSLCMTLQIVSQTGKGS
ncbi:Flavanone 7-O-glucoside 2''-O-beta-L-rhamnosyltransferase [Camellia lanceoleosa]|uniref:Flavanone 7-O-glucoside 2''-O-beta-L-rhamnosyltransferase n=1 Tax=Camellia lanceoleosa TaxID=1840588 RepID=A0ACC0F581_9ERIC|nr:Flavanone 7-O-glucoside 2''-O-beta-L-rhamnosyltransferase [Camellia lanceoleosa]